MTARRLYWHVVALTGAVFAALAFWAGPMVIAEGCPAKAPHQYFTGYPVDVGRSFFVGLTEECRSAYLGPFMRLDTLLSALLAVVLGWGNWRLLGRQGLTLKIGAVALAAGYALFDYLENAAIAGLLATPPDGISDQALIVAGRWTVMKFLFLEASSVVLVALFAARAIRWFGAVAEAEDRVFTVAIDGPAAAGKGTISAAVAREFGFAHLDTGALYRAVGMVALASGGLNETRALNAARGLTPADLERDDLRSAEAADAASKVAAMPGVREALLEFQKRFARRPGGAVLDGRDIGTVVCPRAEVKLYVTATAETRAKRRFDELVRSGTETTFDAVLADVLARDERDANRDAAPMKPAQDAHLLDTTELSIDAAVAEAAALIRTRIEQGRK